MRIQDIEQVIDELNGEYFAVDDDGYFPFELITVGPIKIINFCNYQVWNSEDDPRLYEGSDECEYESLEVYLRREASKLVKQLAVVFK